MRIEDLSMTRTTGCSVVYQRLHQKTFWFSQTMIRSEVTCKSLGQIPHRDVVRKQESVFMSLDEQVKNLMAAFQKTAYFQWMKRQGIPIVDGYGLADVREVQLAPWTRTGGKAAFVNLYGMEGVTGMYVAEIPSGSALEPEKHFYEKVICILEGQGATEVWRQDGRKQMFEWAPWSLFAPPLNTWHRLINGGRQPVKFLAVTNAPLMMDIIHNEDFVFNCPYDFSDRYSGSEDFFKTGQKRYEAGMQHIWETNFIMDIQSAALDQREVKGAGVRITQFELSGNGLIGHLAIAWICFVMVQGARNSTL
jgi:mannose-6-phosphate isomerase-like protein (cupin superfamily)